MQLVESYHHADGMTLTVGSRTFPAVCLAEDEDGMRWLLSAHHDEIPAPTWARAAAAGAVGIIVPGSALLDAAGAPQRCRAITAERFAEERLERPPHYVVPEGAWVRFDHLPTYREVVNGRAGELIVPTTSGFVHVHTHSEYSPLDGVSTVHEIVREAVANGQEAVALTDHGRCSGHPQLQTVCNKAGIKPIFGIEAYFVNDRLIRPEQMEAPVGETDKKGNALTAARKLQYDYWHLVLWALDTEGLHNLWAMSTESYRDGFYYKPRLDWATLKKYSAGVAASSACLRGPLADPIKRDDEDLARLNLGRLLDVFGDRFYLEIQPNQLPEQEKVNRALISLGQDYGVPLIVGVDSHYPTDADHDAHQTWVSLQTDKDVNDETDLFAADLGLWMKHESDVRADLAHLGQRVVDEAVGSTLALARRCSAVIDGKPAAPVYSKKGGADQDVNRLLDLCLANWRKIASQPDQEVYEARFEREFALLRSKGFCGYFLMVSDYCRFAKESGILVGPGRGSGSGSLVAYLADITEVDPVAAKISFERFMTEGRTSLPDFDVDFPASKKEVMLKYLRDKYGDEFVISIGTQSRLQGKGIVKNIGRALMSELLAGVEAYDIPAASGRINADLAAVSKIIEAAEAGTAGLGLGWEELWAQHGDELEPYRRKYPMVFDMADRLVGRLKTYSKHAAGAVISTDRPLTSWLPLFGGGKPGEQMVSQFDMVALEEIGLVKFDILTIRTLDTVQGAIDLIRELRGVDVNVYDWTDEYLDPQVWGEIGDGQTLGIFQIETQSGTRLARRMKPLSMQDLSDMNTIVRPGPMRSGLTEIYLKRRAGEEEVTYQDPRLEKITGEAQGCVIYQDHILLLLMDLAGYGSDEADEVRKILGKKKVEKVAAAGQEFIARAQTWGGMERATVEHLWEQLAEFAKYTFPKGHSYAYSMITYWTAWLKFHYPVEFFTALLSTVDKDRLPVFVKEARKAGLTVYPPDINLSGRGFRAEPLGVRYGLDSINGIGDVAVDALVANQPYPDLGSFFDFFQTKGSKVNIAVAMLLARVGALDSLEPHRAALVGRMEASSSGEDSRCVFKDDGRRYPLKGVEQREGETDDEFAVRWKAERRKLPPDFCTFDWTTEEPPVNPRTGKTLALKILPAKCTKACRQYTPPPPVQPADVEPYSEEDIRSLEHQLLGVFLSSSPFALLDVGGTREELLQDALTMSSGPPGKYTVAAIMMGARQIKTRVEQKEMAFLTLDTEVDTIEATCFPEKWKQFRTGMHDGQLCFVVVEKQAGDRGWILHEYSPVL